MSNVIWFEYKFSSLSEVLNSTKNITEFSVIDYVILVLLIVFIIALVFYILPFISFLIQKHNKSIKSRNRKNLLLKIKTQKDIEDEIDKEMKAEEQEKLEARNKALNYKQ